MRGTAWLLVLLLCIVSPAEASNMRWACYYSDAASPQALSGFDLLVLDSDSHPAISPLRDAGKTVVGYLSIGEVEDVRSHFSAVRDEGILLRENPNWKGSFLVDVRDPRWAKRILEELIPNILRQGFHGVFLDTVDNAAFLEQTNPKTYRGMTDGMVALVKAIRRHYPAARIIMNRGFDILPRVEADIDMVLGESVFSDYDFETRSYRLVPRDEYELQTNILKNAARRRPALTILTLDYWNPEDKPGIARIYAEQRSNGFHPYVATVELDRIVEEPH